MILCVKSVKTLKKIVISSIKLDTKPQTFSVYLYFTVCLIVNWLKTHDRHVKMIICA